jgi:phosphoribosylanthranilate isomerase
VSRIGRVSRTRVKICGITRPGDAMAAAESGADAIGLVFYSGSKRAVSLEQALAIRAVLPAFVSLVGLFVNAEPDEIHRIQDAVHLDCLQFHGNESSEFCEQFAVPYLKALRVRERQNPAAQVTLYRSACGILLDSYETDQPGGTGKTFDWSLAVRCANATDLPIVLAGGLTPGNVSRAIEQVQPWAVDVSSGVESEPGIKCPVRMSEFFEEVYRAQSATAI